MSITHPAQISRCSGRAIAAFGVTFSFVTMAVTGIMLFLAPRGSFARQTDWTLLGLGREGWEAIHLATAAQFLLFGGWHFWVHRRIYVTFLGGTPPAPSGHRLEAVIALVAVLLISIAAVSAWPPSSWLVDGNAYFKKVFWELR